MNWILRLAQKNDIPTLEKLIPLSVRCLQSPYYSCTQIEAALGPIFGVDHQIITDGTYFVAEQQGEIIGCGGWSKRSSLFGGSQNRGEDEDSLLDPESDPARIRAFFVHPAWTRRGIGRSILVACETAMLNEQFHKAELVATLAGEPLYASFGYTQMERYEIVLPNKLSLPVVRMSKYLDEFDVKGNEE